jgi:hypothetical protein
MLETKLTKTAGLDLIREINEVFDTNVSSPDEDDQYYFCMTAPSCGLSEQWITGKTRFLRNLPSISQRTTDLSFHQWQFVGNTSAYFSQCSTLDQIDNWLYMYTQHGIKSLHTPDELYYILSPLRIPVSIDGRVLPILDDTNMKGAQIVASILIKKASNGLPLTGVDVELVTDMDGGQWKEIVFTLHVKLDSDKANLEWDAFLDEFVETVRNTNESNVATAILENIAIHFAWIGE